jgi:cysteinyl-tRNA synthetase
MIERILRLKEDNPDLKAANPLELEGRASTRLQSFRQALEQDLNVPKALVPFWELIRDEDLAPEQRWGALVEMDRIFGLDLASIEPEKLDPQLVSEIEALIEEREQARRRKDYGRADEIRNRLRRRGIIVEDTTKGVRWKKENLFEKKL